MTPIKLNKKVIEGNEIQESLGFQPPYLLIDRITFSDGGSKAIAIKNVAANEPYFNGHFPGYPVMPGVAQLEAMFQLGTIIHRKETDNIGWMPFLFELRKVKFRKPVIPGDRLEISACILSFSKDHIRVKVVSKVGEGVASEAEMEIQFHKSLKKISGMTETSMPPLNPSEDGNSFNVVSIQDIIPHRFPFVFIDRILYNQVDKEGRSTMIGLKNVTFNERLSLSQFGQVTLLPNTFLIEMIAQVGCIRTLSQPQNQGKFVYFISVDQAKFYQPVLPGDQVYVQAKTLVVKERFGKGEGHIFINGLLVAEANIKFAIIER